MRVNKLQSAAQEAPASFSSLSALALALTEALRPQERLLPSQAAEKYRLLHNPGAYSGPYLGETTPYMAEPLDILADREKRACIFVGPAQTGKALPLDTSIATPEGWTTMGELVPGSLVFGSDGCPVRVLGVSPVMTGHQCYEVVFDDGTTLVADAEHLWTVKNAATGRHETVSTEHIRQNLSYRVNRRRYSVRNPQALTLPDADLPIPPYLLGVWLGDGHGAANSLHLNKLDSDILVRVFLLGYNATVSEDNNTGGFVARVHSGFGRALSALGVRKPHGSKHIPRVYQRASRAQRLELLRGLLDTDGCASEGVVTFCTTEPALRDGFAELVCGLGFKFHVRERTTTYEYLGERRQGKPSWEFTLAVFSEQQVFHTARKAAKVPSARHGKPSMAFSRRVVAVNPVASVPVRCIKVDAADSLYLAGRAMVPTHNTDSLILNALLYTIICDPMDSILYQTSQTVAADFSRTRLDRMHRHSPMVGRHVLPGGSADTVHAKYYDSGIVVNLSWPTINEMSGKPRGLVLLTDYDRMPQNIDGEGSPFDLGMKRTTTFRSKGKTICESSPGFEVEAGAMWVPRTRHEAPPCKGILALYNRGDRRRWHWKCPHCGEWFEPTFETLRWPEGVSPGEAGQRTWMACPTNGCVLQPSAKYGMNKAGRWVKDGQRLRADDTLEGEAVSSSYASFWMFGPAAAFVSWGALVEKYLMAEDEYQRTGSQEALKATVNTDQGMPYRPRGTQRERTPEELKGRSESWPAGTVPPDVRFLIATVDVQGRKWVCQVFGVSPGTPYDLAVIDRFDITKSKRLDADGHPLPTEPHAYPEDWHLLTDALLEREYPIAGTEARMRVRATFCDSGGKEGVTARAYQFWMALRSDGSGLHRRFQLVKGDPAPGAPRARISYMDAQVKGQAAAVRGEVPVLMLASNTLKDDLNGRLDRVSPGGGMVRFPEHLPDAFFTEMCVEIRSEKGWDAPRGHRQEAWDLCYYAIGACVHLGVEKVDWSQPPAWALPWDRGNALVRIVEPDKPEQKMRFAASNSFTGAGDFAKLLAS